MDAAFRVLVVVTSLDKVALVIKTRSTKALLEFPTSARLNFFALAERVGAFVFIPRALPKGF